MARRKHRGRSWVTRRKGVGMVRVTRIRKGKYRVRKLHPKRKGRRRRR